MVLAFIRPEYGCIRYENYVAPPPSIVSDVKLWAPRVASVDTNQTSSECSVTAQTSPYVPYVPPANSGIPGSMESMGGSGAVGFSYAFAAEASFGKVTRGDVCETVAPNNFSR